MSDSNKQKKLSTSDIQKKITEIMLRRNPNCTAGEVGRNYANLKKYLTGEWYELYKWIATRVL